MMIYTMTPETADMAGRTLLEFLDRIPSSERTRVQGLALFVESLGRVHAKSLTLTVEAE